MAGSGPLANEERIARLRRENQVILIAGPTASGKSALAVRIANALGGEIVNADSMQVYRDLAILSARPTLEEQAGIPHHLFGFVDGAHEFSVGEYLSAVSVLPRARPLIFVGGTGLYFRALTEGLVETPLVPAEIRAAIAMRAAAGEDMHAALRGIDPASAERLSPADLPRIQRALEMQMATGEAFSTWREKHQSRPLLPQGSWKGLFLTPDRETLNARIDRRFEAMMVQGAPEEVRALKARGLPTNRGVMKAHGVPHLVRYLDGEIALQEAIRLGQQDTRNYAKRQLTWARKFMREWIWVEGATDGLEALHMELSPS